MLIDIASFDLLPTDTLNYKIFAFNENSTEPYNKWFDQQGFNTMRVISNIGSSFYYFFISLFFVLVYGITKNFQNKPICVKVTMYLKSKLFWAQFLRLLTEGYIDISLSCLINI
jgi:hypothetical protein